MEVWALDHLHWFGVKRHRNIIVIEEVIKIDKSLGIEGRYWLTFDLKFTKFNVLFNREKKLGPVSWVLWFRHIFISKWSNPAENVDAFYSLEKD